MREQRELGGRQHHLAVVDGTACGRPAGAPGPSQFLLTLGEPAARRNTALDPGDQLTRAERLGHVVVGTQLEADDPVHLVVAGGHEQHGGPVAGRAHPAAHLDAVQPGQADVEDDGDGVQPADRVERACAVALDVHPESLPAQVEPDEVGDGPIVLDDEDEAARFGVGFGLDPAPDWGG